MNMTSQQQWESAKTDPARFVPLYPVKPCPHCGRDPMFLRFIGEGKCGKLTWEALDYCGSVKSPGYKYIGDTISNWNGAVSYEVGVMRRESGNGYWQIRKYEKKLQRWQDTVNAIPLFKRLWLGLTGKLPKKPEPPNKG